MVLQLLESYRNAKGQPRNRVVVSLGNPKIRKSDWGLIASGVEAILYGESELFNPTPNQQSWIDSIVRRIEREGRWNRSVKSDSNTDQEFESEVIDGVLIDDIDHTHDTSLGPELLGLHAWEKLNLDGLLQSLQFNKAQRNAACVSIINRLVDSVPENALIEWLSTSSLPDILGEDVLSVGKNRYYRISDRLLKHQKEIESHLRTMIKGQFNFPRTILLYDLTNTHFEGSCKLNTKAKRGRNKQKRHDCLQVAVGVCFDEQGFVQFHKTFPGNTGDSTTLLEMVLEMENCRDADLFDSGVNPLVIVDAGIATKKNLEILREKGFDYLVNETRKKRKEYKKHFQEEGKFELIEGRENRSAVRIRMMEEKETVSDSSGNESAEDKKAPKTTVELVESVAEPSHEEEPMGDRVVLCRSAQRAAKEEAILSGAEKKFIKDMEGLSQRIAKGQLVDPVKIQRAIGKIQGRHVRISRYYDVKLESSSSGKQAEPEKHSKSSKLAKKKPPKKEEVCVNNSLSWTRDDSEYEKTDELFGCYALRTNRQLPALQLWHLYMILTTAESGFRAMKSDLGLRPNHHRQEFRSDGHIFITILAYQLQRFVLYSLSLLGDTRCWRTLKRVTQSHTYSTILVPTNDGTLYRIRKPGRPEACQKHIYHQLGINLGDLPKSKIKIKKQPTTL